jgi:hypothetical protein
MTMAPTHPPILWVPAEERIGRTANLGRWFSVAQWSDESRRACAVTLFCLGNNSDVEVTGSLLLLHCVLLPCAVCLFLSADEISW